MYKLPGICADSGYLTGKRGTYSMKLRNRDFLNNDRRKRMICVILSICAALFLTQTVIVNRALAAEEKISRTQKELAGEVLRFHVLAESDSKEDQAVKLKVRDAVICYMKKELPKSSSAEDTKMWAKEHLSQLEAVAEAVIREEGASYGAKAEVVSCYFPDKQYGDVFFPKGYYEALRIELGSAEGHNWWCVLYPNLCFTDAACAVVDEEGKQELKNVLTEEEYEMVTATSEFKIKSFFFGDLFKERK